MHSSIVQITHLEPVGLRISGCLLSQSRLFAKQAKHYRVVILLQHGVLDRRIRSVIY